MQKTFGELQEIDTMVGGLYKRFPTLENTKFGYAYSRFYKLNYLPVFNAFQDAIHLVRIETALEDKNTREVMIDPANVRGYKYDKDGLAKCVVQERNTVEEYTAKFVDIIPFISPYVPEELTEQEKELLTGLIL
jgi:hypothetical protein